MEKMKIIDLIDFEEVNKLLEGFNQTTGFVTAILDLEGNVLSKSGWRQICTEFHRINPETSKNCTISDTVLANELGNGEKYHFYECLNGLVDVAVPIVIKGEHIANLFSGQFFFEKPDRSFFKKQALTYRFNEESYLKALEKVPTVSKEKVKIAMDFLLDMTQLISEITFQKLEQLQLNNALRKSEERFRSAFDHMMEGCQIIGFDWRYIYLNRTAEIHNRRPNKELLGNYYHKMWPGIEKTEVYRIIKQTLETRIPNHFENEFTFPNGSRGWFDLSIQPVPEGVFILSIDITERKKQEELLYESEFRFYKLYENGPFGMVIADKEFRFKKANPAFCSILGYSEAELQQFTFKYVSHPDDLVKDLVNVRKLMDKEISVYKTEKRYIRKDGQVIWGSLTVTATYDSEGQFLYNLGIIEDITRRKQTEEELKRLNERITTATQASQVGIWDWDIQNNLLNWDDQMYALYGLKKGEFTGAYEAWINGLHPDDREFSHNETRRALLGEKEYDTEFRVVWPDGTVHYEKAKGEVFRNENGEPVRMVGVNYDITEQKKKYEKIREKDMEFRKLSANVPDLIFQFTRKPDGSYCVPIASEGIRNIFGCTPEEVFNDFTPIGRVIYPEDTERVIRDIEYSAEHLTYFTCEFRVQIPGREIQWIYSKSSPEQLPDGSVTWYGFNTNITDRKLAEQELINAKEKAEESDRLKTAFLSNMSHEIRTPLNSIIGFSDLLLDPFFEQEQQIEFVNTIKKSGNNLIAIIDDIMDISRIETGQITFRKDQFSVNKLIKNIGFEQSHLAKNSDFEIKIDIPEQDIVIKADEGRIKQILMNLVNNAIKFSERGRIEIGCSQTQNAVQFYVKDSGIGISKEYHQKIFERFRQVEPSHTRKYGGIGLGLAISKQLSELMGGKIEVESEPGIGSTFTLTMPV